MEFDVKLCTSISLHEKKILFVAPHQDDDAIGCGAFLFYLTKLASSYGSSAHTQGDLIHSQVDLIHKPKSIHVAYAVSGFNGISDCFLKKEGILTDEYKKLSVEEQRKVKSQIRKDEALHCCEFLGVKPVFWNLPFYESNGQVVGGLHPFSSSDVDVVKESINQVQPDIIFLIDEASDPHGTHGIVKRIVLQALKDGSFNGTVVGYRVWEEGYSSHECGLVLSFGEKLMKEKENLISFYRSQTQDPAYPCKHKDFIELARETNKKIALQMDLIHRYNRSDLSYAECYKILKF